MEEMNSHCVRRTFLYVQDQDEASKPIELILPHWQALVHVAQLFGWAPAGELPYASNPSRSARAKAAARRLAVCHTFAPGGRDRLSAFEAAELAEALEQALPDAGSHAQFLEVEDEDDIFATRATPLQWLGLDCDMLATVLLPTLRRGAVDLFYEEDSEV